MYRNIYYDYKNSVIHLWTWDQDDQRSKVEIDFEPFIYIEDKNQQDAVSIFNTNLKKLKLVSHF
jgi:hypothetical protein